MKLKDCFKAGGKDYDKARSPEETLDWVFERFRKFDQPVLKSVERIDKDRLGIPVYVSRYEPGACMVTGSARQMGKGITDAQARASAVMEIVERFSLFQFLNSNSMACMPRNRLAEPAFPRSLLLKAIHSQDVPEKALDFLDEFPIQWAEGLDTCNGESIPVPFSWVWPINKYNGAAAGNSLEEAAVQAISEVVERHVCSLISYNRISTPSINMNSIRDQRLCELIERFSRIGIKLILKDFSLGLGIPTVGAIAWDPSTFPERSEIVYTAGTSTSPVRAAIRAVTEVAQLAGDFDTEGKYLESGLPKFQDLDEAEYVLSSDNTVDMEQLPDLSSDNFYQEVTNLTSQLYQAGLLTYLLDVTHPDLGIPAVYAVIPGNHFRERTRNLSLPLHMAKTAVTGGYLDLQQQHNILLHLDNIFPGRFETAFYLGHLEEEAGRFDLALNYFKLALERQPDSTEIASIYCHQGSCLMEMGETEQAIAALKKAKQHNSALKEIHNLLGTCYYRQEDFISAIECFEKAIAIDPSSAIDYANIGSNLRKLGMKELARQWYNTALEMDPELEWARQHLAEMDNGDSQISSTRSSELK